jgi:serine/threonine protein kinase
VGVIFLPRKDGTKAEIVIKEFRSRGVNKLKSVFLPSKALKAWAGAHKLLEGGIDTPFPVAYIEERRRFSIRRSYYLSERVRGVEEIRYLFPSLPPLELKALLRSLASYLSTCHRRGVLHRDLSDGNILTRRKNQDQYQFFLIDTNRIRAKKHISLLCRVKNLIRLGIPPESQRFFLSHYLGKHRVKRPLWIWYRLQKRSYTWYIEMKRKLKLRQLARRLRIQ